MLLEYNLKIDDKEEWKKNAVLMYFSINSPIF